MNSPSKVANEASRRHWARSVGNASSPDAIAEAIDRICMDLRSTMSRWVGTESYDSLRERTLVHAPPSALRSHAFDGGDYLATLAAIRSHGSDAVTEGIVRWLAHLIDALSRVVGEAVAVRLVEQTATAGPRSIVSRNRGEVRDDE